MADLIPLEFRVLGPLETVVDGRRMDVAGNRQQIVLASLVLDAGKVVSVGRLMTAIYGEQRPASARAQVQICVSGLRRLFTAYGRADAIATRNQGYVLAQAGVAVDLQRYERLIAEARAGSNAGRKEESVERYREALALWRGPALEGLDSGPLRTAANHFAERRLTVNEDCIEYELELGRHREVIAELVGLVAAHPLRERLRGQLMLALYRSGRQAEALEAYRAARRTLIDELGLEPSEWLQHLERSILTSESGLALPLPRETVVSAAPAPETEAVVGEVLAVSDSGPHARSQVSPPRMLPTDIADFTGREQQIEVIDRELARAAENPRQLAVPIMVVTGKLGVGKTTLGVHVAHRLASRYPDGQLFADLHGWKADYVGPMRILERFLRTLGVPGTSIPDGLEERAEMYRGLLSDRRVLVVLDNAGAEEHVLPLLPGSPRTAVIVTSRGRLGGLPGAMHVDIDVLEPRQCIELLSRIAGESRIRAETDASAELTELCGRLPLALRIAGARLAARPHWSVEQLADRLASESRRLDELKHGAMGIRVNIAITYGNISDDARRLFRLLAALDFPVFSGWMCAALLDRSLRDAHDLLDELADAQLVEIAGDEQGPRSQYRFHELIRVFARERLAVEESPQERNAARERVIGGLLFLAEQAHKLLYGDGNRQVHGSGQRWKLPSRATARRLAEPLAWFERERQSIVAAVSQAATIGAVQLCWDLAVTAVTLFESRAYLDDWRSTHRIALDAARQAGDELGQAVVLSSMGALGIVERRFAFARQQLDQAGDLFRAFGEEHGLATVNRNIAYLEQMDGDLPEAVRRYQMALDVLRDIDPVDAAYVLQNMAQIALERGDPDGAKLILAQALEMSRKAGSRRTEAQALHRLGNAHLQAGQPAEAAAVFGEALVAVRDLGDPIGEAYMMHGLGMASLRVGDYVRAKEALTDARVLTETNGDRLVAARVEHGLGELALATHAPREAVAHLYRALTMFRSIQAPAHEERVLSMLTQAYEAAGDLAQSGPVQV
ncbi:AfsR/SARP family transcriptional regulator [Krasilnikovia sp. MM14-A1259]|uniref:AfsR/SARP family transcriptional regulator n=1 Tax=Krasilnikovia sp. MM14-A1259 TaxID=3373539 RepID=UPI0038278579